MKCAVVLIIIFVVFLLCAVALGQNSDVPKTIKNQDDNDRWIWSSADDYKNNSKQTDDRNNGEQSSSTVFPPYDDPCLVFRPTKPNFSTPGRTISDEKCAEYKWNKLMQEETAKRKDECWKKISNRLPSTILGGRPTRTEEFPHMGAIGWKAVVEGFIFKCGGSLISSKFVLTAAHCSRASSADTTLADPVPKVVRLTDTNLYQTDEAGFYLFQDFNISRIIVHPKFKPPKLYFDIALLKLETEVTFTRAMQPACLWKNGDVSELGKEATVTGWGVLHQGSLQISPELQAAVVNFINSTYCDQLLYSSRNRNWRGLQENQLCAGKLAGGVDACQGDSGGPLQVKQPIPGSAKEAVYYVIGVTSFGIGCGLPKLPGIYTRVSSFIPWIESYVWPQA